MPSSSIKRRYGASLLRRTTLPSLRLLKSKANGVSFIGPSTRTRPGGRDADSPGEIEFNDGSGTKIGSSRVIPG
jgi:hypothetical protein